MMKFYMYLILLFLLNFVNLNLLKIFFYNLSLLLFLMMFKNLNSYYMNIYYWLGMDKLSYSLMLLSIFMILIMYLISLNMKYKKLYSLLLSILLMSLLLSFNSLNYFLFYLFFEMSLIPTFILIMMFGYQPERLNASMYMMLYTLFASLPLLIIMFILFKIFNNLNYYFMYKLLLLNFNNLMFYFFMMFAFLIKLPMFMFHMWLPKAHVEAPVSGSVILAGVMLKLGGYGIIRSMNMMIKYCMMFNTYMLSLNLLGMIFLSILCLRQSDLKIIVAYSSVVHMSLMLSSLMTMYLYSKYSSLLMMLGHGFCSPALFIMVNIIYIRSKTRNIYMNKGLINIFPSLMFWWFMLCINNMASPISLNLISEIFIMMSLMNWINKIFIILMTCMFFSAMYNLFLFLMIYHNNYNNMFNSLINNKIIEFFYLFLLWLPLNILILKLEIFI